MKRIINTYTILVLGVLTLTALLVNIFLFNQYPEIVIEKSNRPLIPFFCYLIVFVFHVLSILFLSQSFKNQKKYRGFKIFILVVFVISIISFMMDKVMIDELADDVRYGFKYSLIMITIPLLVKIFYTLLVLIQVYLLLTDKEVLNIHEKKDETIFVMAQIVGLISGLLGMMLVLSHFLRTLPNPGPWIPAYTIFFVPYGIIVCYWLVLKIRENISEWYDEKQWKDVLRAAFTTLILSIPGLGFLFIFKKPTEFYWFPYYIFFILIVFSGLTLIFYKRT